MIHMDLLRSSGGRRGSNLHSSVGHSLLSKHFTRPMTKEEPQMQWRRFRRASVAVREGSLGMMLAATIEVSTAKCKIGLISLMPILCVFTQFQRVLFMLGKVRHRKPFAHLGLHDSNDVLEDMSLGEILVPIGVSDQGPQPP